MRYSCCCCCRKNPCGCYADDRFVHHSRLDHLDSPNNCDDKREIVRNADKYQHLDLYVAGQYDLVVLGEHYGTNAGYDNCTDYQWIACLYLVRFQNN